MSKPPLFAFFGTPRFATLTLDAMERRGALPALVVTAPDRKRGRGMELQPSPAKAWARERGIDCIEPESLKDDALLAELRNTEWDVFVTAAYGKLLPKTVLDIPRRGCLNIHPSLLPKFRGPSPVISAILADERQTGVSVMLMDEKMDAGPVVAQARIEIAPEDWPPTGSMFEELLATEGGNLLCETLPHWIAGDVEAQVQDESGATYTRKFIDEDARIDLSADPHQNLLKIRAFDAGPRAYFTDPNGKRVIITRARIENGALVLERVIPEGKKEVDFEAYSRASG